MPQNNNAARGAAIATAVIALILACLGAFGASLHGPVVQAAAPTQRPIILIASPTPGVATVPRLVVAYAAPDGDVLGPMDIARESVAPVGRQGSSWAQVQRADGTRVWVRSGDLMVEQQSVALQQPDVSPPPPVVMSVPQPVAAWQPPVSAPQPIQETVAPPPVIDLQLNDPSLNGGNVAPIGCPFPIVNGVCANGALARDVPDQYATDDLQKQQDYLNSERRSAVVPTGHDGDVPTGGGK